MGDACIHCAGLLWAAAVFLAEIFETSIQDARRYNLGALRLASRPGSVYFDALIDISRLSLPFLRDPFVLITLNEL